MKYKKITEFIRSNNQSYNFSEDKIVELEKNYKLIESNCFDECIKKSYQINNCHI